MVQEELRRRKDAGNYTTSVSILSSRIVCAECGGFYGRKVWHAGSQYAESVWHCNNKFRKRRYCGTPTLRENAIKDAFISAFNAVIENKAEIFANYEEALDLICDDRIYRKEVTQIDSRCAELETLVQKLISTNARSQTEQDDYNARYDAYIAAYDERQKRRRELTSKIALCAAKRVQIAGFLAELKKHNAPLSHFDDRVWQATLHHMAVEQEGRIVFVFRDGTELKWTVKQEIRKYAKTKHLED